MPSTTITVGEFLFDMTLDMKGVSEYGTSMEALMSGQIPPPPAGARFDVAFEGTLDGPRLKGTFTGTDYIYIRPDGRAQLHIHADITTDDGEKIAAFADGVATPEEGTGLLQERQNATFTTSSAKYSWLNPLQVWAIGVVDPGKGVVTLKGYVA
jgi:hypothetical protein